MFDCHHSVCRGVYRHRDHCLAVALMSTILLARSCPFPWMAWNNYSSIIITHINLYVKYSMSKTINPSPSHLFSFCLNSRNADECIITKQKFAEKMGEEKKEKVWCLFR